MTTKAATVTELRSARRAADAAPSSARPARKAPATARRAASPAARTPRISTLQRRMGYGFGALALSLTALSLSHLAEGVTLVAHRASWEGWSVAGAVDLGFIAAEVMPFCVSAECAADTRIVRRALTVVVLLASAAFNALAFSEGATSGLMQAAAVTAGVAVPLFIGAFTHLASRCLIGRAPAA